MKIKQNWPVYTGILLAGLLLGYLLFGLGTDRTPEELDPEMEEHIAEAHTDEDGDIVWTCSMHPSVREDEPGDCPICGMELIPAGELGDDVEVDDYSMVMTEAAVQRAQIQTVAAERRIPEKRMRLPGRVEVDERQITSVTTHFPGRIRQLHVNYTGAPISKGEVMATVYSPELVSAQRELLQAVQRSGRDSRAAESARSKLRQWEITDQQIQEIIDRGEVEQNMDIYSPADGFVIARNVAREDYVGEGSVLFEVADLQNLWLIMEAYEEDLEWISAGDEFTFTPRSRPGNNHTATINYIEPVVNPATRTARVRADINNAGGQLKPEMLIYSELNSRGSNGEQVMVPASSVLWSGPRSLVYVQDTAAEIPRFEVREVELGHRAGDWYVIHDGIEAGEKVVFHGAFRIDSEMQLADRFSMMNREPGSGAVPVHDHGGMDNDDMDEHEDLEVMQEVEETDVHEHTEAVDGATEEFREDFRALLAHYLHGKNALFESDYDAVGEAFRLAADELESIGPHRMDGDAHMKWMEQYEAIEGHFEHIQSADDIEEQREAFAIMSHVLIEAVRNYEIPGVLYHQHCPMVDADWLSEREEVQNPFMPDEMPGCGEVITELEY